MYTKGLVAAVIAIVIASPALGQRASQQRQQSATQQRQHSSNPAYDVYVGGQYVGSDPDPSIRAQLQRRQPGGQW
jgi:hypothetical protein